MSPRSNTGSVSDLQLNLARKIIHLIGEQSLEAGTFLREEELARRFKVSRSPVRSTLKFLYDLDVLDQQANRGYFLKKDGAELAASTLDLPQTGDKKICERIGRDWFEGKIPRELSETEVRRKYKLGRSTAARILQKLSDEGVISRLPGYGWQFEPTLDTLSAHDESYEFRIINEPAAILLPNFKLNKAQAQLIRSRHNSVLANKQTDEDISLLFDIDVQFHEFVSGCSGNRFLLATIVRQNRLRRLVEYASLIDTGRLQGSCKEHLAILDALEADEMKLASRLMAEHLQKAQAFGPSYGEEKSGIGD